MRRLAGRKATPRQGPRLPRSDDERRLLHSRWLARPNLLRLVLLAWLVIQPLIQLTAVADAQEEVGVQDRGLNVVGQYGGLLGAIAVREPYVYLSVGPRLVVIDVSNPRDAVVVGQTSPTSPLAVDMVVRGDFAYVARTGGLGIVDVTDPAYPVEIGAVPLAVPPRAPLPASAGGMPRRVALAGNYAFVAALGAGVRVIDVGDPRRPMEVGAWTPVQGEVEEAIEVAAAAGGAGYVYVGTQRAGGAFTAENGLHILDVSRPADPREVSFYSTTNPVAGIAVSGHHVYLGSLPLLVLDVSDLSNPMLVRGGFPVSSSRSGSP